MWWWGKCQKLMKDKYTFDYFFDADNRRKEMKMTIGEVEILAEEEEEQLKIMIENLMRLKSYGSNPIQDLEEKIRYI